jgi:4-hydroxyphenylpyruvate dioxygenase
MTLQEALPEPSNPVGIDGLEFIEFATAQPQALGALAQSWASRRWRATARAR